MGVFPKINFSSDFENIKKSEEIKNSLNFGKTYLIDFSRKKIMKLNGKAIKTDDERAVRMWIEKVILTQKNKYKIYDNTWYGMEYKENLQGKRFPTSFLKAEFIRELDETMSRHPKILEIRDLKVEMIQNTLKTSFFVKLKNFKEFTWEGDLK